jgi:hypothetical protein
MINDGQDDCHILAVGRAVASRGGELRFDPVEPVEAGFKVTASLRASVTVTLLEEVAHGRAMALRLLLKGRNGI